MSGSAQDGQRVMSERDIILPQVKRAAAGVSPSFITCANGPNISAPYLYIGFVRPVELRPT